MAMPAECISVTKLLFREAQDRLRLARSELARKYFRATMDRRRPSLYDLSQPGWISTRRAARRTSPGI